MANFSDIYNFDSNTSKILVLGDIIYDKYLFGSATRLSPEAPVPIFQPHREEFKLGGASNVFNNIASLGGVVQLCGIVGNDEEGKSIKKKVIDLNNTADLIFTEYEGATIKKTRLLVDNHYLLRIDEENIYETNRDRESEIFNIINDNIDLYDLLVISDYNKGFLGYSFTKKIVNLFIGKNKKIIVDPKCDFYKYEGAYLIKPNINELSKFVRDDRVANDYNLLVSYCNDILKEGNFKYIYVTMGEKGGILIGEDIGVQSIPAFGEDVIDVVGAGDSVLAALAIAVVADIGIIRAANFASYIAGISVSKPGTSLVNKFEIITN